MERTDILTLMGELKLYGMRAAWPEGRIAWGVNGRSFRTLPSACVSLSTLVIADLRANR